MKIVDHSARPAYVEPTQLWGGNYVVVVSHDVEVLLTRLQYNVLRLRAKDLDMEAIAKKLKTTSYWVNRSLKDGELRIRVFIRACRDLPLEKAERIELTQNILTDIGNLRAVPKKGDF